MKQKSGTSAWRTITDMQGNSVRVADPLERVALLGGPTGQVAYILGVQDRLCAVTASLRNSVLVRSMDPRIKSLPGPRTTSGNINIESLLAAQPQLVISGSIDGGIVRKKTSIPVALLEDNMGQSTADLKREIHFYASVFQAQDRARRYIAYLEKTQAFLRQRTADIPADKRPVVFNGYGAAHLVTLGGDTFMQEHIITAGCRNAAQRIGTTGKREGLHSGLDEVSMEQILGWNPDVIIIDSGMPETLYNDPRWRAIKAVKQRRVVRQPVGIFIWDRPTAESAVLYPLWLACTAFPERFNDINLAEEIRRFYTEVLDFKLSEEQARKVLDGSYGSITYNR